MRIASALASFLAAVAAVLSLAGDAAAQPGCPTCGRDVDPAFKFCPEDGTRLPLTCADCGRAMDRAWSFCPFDGKPIQPAPAAAPGEATPGKAAAPPAGAPSTPGAPAPAAAPGTGTPPAAGTPPAVALPPGSPLAVVDAVFDGIQAGDVEGLRPLYLWPAFFPDAKLEELDGTVTKYLERLVERVRPTLDHTTRKPVNVQLGAREATIRVLVRNGSARQTTEYVFTLVADDEGWKVTSIRP